MDRLRIAAPSFVDRRRRSHSGALVSATPGRHHHVRTPLRSTRGRGAPGLATTGRDRFSIISRARRTSDSRSRRLERLLDVQPWSTMFEMTWTGACGCSIAHDAEATPGDRAYERRITSAAVVAAPAPSGANDQSEQARGSERESRADRTTPDPKFAKCLISETTFPAASTDRGRRVAACAAAFRPRCSSRASGR